MLNLLVKHTITASFNNIIISLTNKKGDVISWSSAGKQWDLEVLKRILHMLLKLAAEDCARVANEAGLEK